eukprot:GHVO01017671.1.p1 GENE.GHVO01017671.1~~GHVO01017671.1.p1  ORF type:complete len:546 (+),score=88.77 GHVO01017671.1:56-1693(+)
MQMLNKDELAIKFDDGCTLNKDCAQCTTGGATPSTTSSIKCVADAPPVGVFEVFKVGLGPSSSHTNGPMNACCDFVEHLKKLDPGFANTKKVVVDLYGSLALTGKGHSTDLAVLIGLSGTMACNADPDKALMVFGAVKNFRKLQLGGEKEICLKYDEHVVFNCDIQYDEHPNALKVTAYDKEEKVLFVEEYLSVGGGKIVTVSEFRNRSTQDVWALKLQLPYPYKRFTDIIRYCKRDDITIAQLMMKNEIALTGMTEKQVEDGLDRIYDAMTGSIERGLKIEGPLPLKGMKRQACQIHKRLRDNMGALSDHFAIMDWVILYARAVNEENACGGRVVTAPTNGSCGTIPAVAKYFQNFSPFSSQAKIRELLLTASAVGSIVKMNASVSGAEAGCQAEVGTACSMAAAGLAAVSGGSLAQIERAAEGALQYNLGMICDPIAGVVVVPCIERNCVAAVQSITSARLALKEIDASMSLVSLDSCIEVMYTVGKDMQSKYRETSQGGLAITARRNSAYEIVTPKRDAHIGEEATDSDHSNTSPDHSPRRH